MRRRLATLGLTGLVLIVMTVGAIRIHRLEQRVASLEAARSTAGGVNAAFAPGLNLSWTDSQQAPVPFADPFPEGMTRHEINGMTYYVMPLADNRGMPATR
jgi:hypothetical protein